MHFSHFPFSIYIFTNHVNLLSFDNDEMKPSKSQVSFISLFFVLKRISKSNPIRLNNGTQKALGVF